MKKQPHYTHVDEHGLRWRFVGSRPVSELADLVMRETGIEWPKDRDLVVVEVAIRPQRQHRNN